MGLFDLFKPKQKGQAPKATSRKKRVLTVEEITPQILAQKESLKQNGFKRYKIISCNDACEVCKAFEGKDFALSKMEIGKNAPPFHDGCKCSIVAYEDNKDYEKWLASLERRNKRKR